MRKKNVICAVLILIFTAGIAVGAADLSAVP